MANSVRVMWQGGELFSPSFYHVKCCSSCSHGQLNQIFCLPSAKMFVLSFLAENPCLMRKKKKVNPVNLGRNLNGVERGKANEILADIKICSSSNFSVIPQAPYANLSLFIFQNRTDFQSSLSDRPGCWPCGWRVARSVFLHGGTTEPSTGNWVKIKGF